MSCLCQPGQPSRLNSLHKPTSASPEVADASCCCCGSRVLVRLSVVEASGLSLFRGEDVIGKAEDFSGVNAGKSLTIPSVSKVGRGVVPA